jgi:hypothetical protein
MSQDFLPRVIKFRATLVDLGYTPTNGKTFMDSKDGRYYSLAIDDNGWGHVVADWMPGTKVWFGDTERPKPISFAPHDSRLPRITGTKEFTEKVFLDAAKQARLWVAEERA